MKRRILFSLAFAATLLSADAQQPVYSLKEAIDHSLQHHGSTKIYANSIEIARQQARQALSAYLPQVNANFGLDDNLRLQTTVIPAGAFGSTEARKVQFGNKYNTNAVVQLEQTIYDQALLFGIKAGAPAKKIAELQGRQNNENLMFRTASAYTQILLLKEQQKLLAQNAKQYEELYKITKYRFDKGVVKKVDLDRIDVSLNNIRAQQKQITTDIEVSYNSLKNAMGLPLNEPIAVSDSIDFTRFLDIPAETVSVKNLVDYQLGEQNLSLQEIDLKRQKAAGLPTVSAYARYGGQAFGNEIGQAVTNFGSYSAVGLKVNIPIFSGRRRDAQVQETRLNLEKTKQNLELTASNLELQFLNAGRQLQENITSLTTNRNNMNLARSVYETSQYEYNKGVSSMSDVLNADYSYQQAQSNYMTALLNLVTNRLDYERAKGTLGGFVGGIR